MFGKKIIDFRIFNTIILSIINIYIIVAYAEMNKRIEELEKKFKKQQQEITLLKNNAKIHDDDFKKYSKLTASVTYCVILCKKNSNYH